MVGLVKCSGHSGDRPMGRSAASWTILGWPKECKGEPLSLGLSTHQVLPTS